MIGACNTGGTYNVLRDIDRNFTVQYFVHGSKSRMVHGSKSFQYHDNAFEYVGPTRCRRTPDEDEQVWGRPDF